MPYDPSDPPEKVRGLPEKKKRQWVHVFNSAYEKYGNDEKAHKLAWGVTGGWRKDKGYDPEDPDRDILLEMEVEKRLDIEDQVMGLLGEEVTIKGDPSA